MLLFRLYLSQLLVAIVSLFILELSSISKPLLKWNAPISGIVVGTPLVNFKGAVPAVAVDPVDALPTITISGAVPAHVSEAVTHNTKPAASACHDHSCAFGQMRLMI